MQAYAHHDEGASSCENHFTAETGVEDDDILDCALDIAEDLQISTCVSRGVEQELSRLKKQAAGDGCVFTHQATICE